jgi:hypothetical protein
MSARTAAPAVRFERCSITRPSRRNTVTTAATSKYTNEEGSWTGANMPPSWRMSSRPAVPNNSAQTLHSVAAPVPSVISVSIVIAPWRAFAIVARWKGHPPHTTTGTASTNETHCQPGNCHAGIMPSTTTGTASAVLTHSRVISGVAPGRSSTSWT